MAKTFNQTFGKVTKPKNKSLKKNIEEEKEIDDIPFSSSFGKPPKPKEKPAKKATVEKHKVSKRRFAPKKVIKKIEKDLTAIEVLHCPDREETNYFICNKKYCKCDFKLYYIEDFYIEYNKKIIIDYFSKIKNPMLAPSSYDLNFLEESWSYRKNRNTLTDYELKFRNRVKNYIKKIKIVHRLETLKTELWEKEKTVRETLDCPDRIKTKIHICQYNNLKVIDGKQCYCHYGNMTIKKIAMPFLKELLLDELKKKKIVLSYWDRVVLSFDWEKLFSDKQNSSYIKFRLRNSKIVDPIIKYIKNYQF